MPLPTLTDMETFYYRGYQIGAAPGSHPSNEHLFFGRYQSPFSDGNYTVPKHCQTHTDALELAAHATDCMLAANDEQAGWEAVHRMCQDLREHLIQSDCGRAA